MLLETNGDHFIKEDIFLATGAIFRQTNVEVLLKTIDSSFFETNIVR